MTPASSFLDALKLAAEQAGRAEEDFRRQIAERTKMFEQERAYAHRRLNFMRAIAEAGATAETEETPVAAATTRARTWSVRPASWSYASTPTTVSPSRRKPLTSTLDAARAP